MYRTVIRLVIGATLSIALAACQTPPAAPEAYTGPVIPIEQGERGVQLFLPSTVLFESGSAEFKAREAAPYLQRMAVLVQTKTDKKISIEGHADNVGTPTVNQTLSEARAASVRKALVDAGVAPERMVTQGFSFNRPIASNATESGRALNRRVELTILDEQVANITRGEPANAFSSAWAQLKALVDSGAVQPVTSR